MPENFKLSSVRVETVQPNPLHALHAFPPGDFTSSSARVETVQPDPLHARSIHRESDVAEKRRLHLVRQARAYSLARTGSSGTGPRARTLENLQRTISHSRSSVADRPTYAEMAARPPAPNRQNHAPPPRGQGPPPRGNGPPSRGHAPPPAGQATAGHGQGPPGNHDLSQGGGPRHYNRAPPY